MATKKFRGNYKSLAKIGAFVISQAKLVGLNDQDIYNVQLAVDEACSNIIEHAYGGENIGDIVCTCSAYPNQLEILLIDHGQKFNPQQVKRPKVGAPIDEYGPRGAGLYLIKNIMDDVDFEFFEGETRLRMIKNKN